MDYQYDNISTNNFEQCTKCTICTAYCPVTAVNPLFPGPKEAGPDGERYRLKNREFYDVALKYCNNCKRCEVSCPSNVRIADIIQSAHLKYVKGKPSLRNRLLADPELLGGVATKMAGAVNATLRAEPVKEFLDKVLGIDKHITYPAYASRRFGKWFTKYVAQSQRAFPRQVTYYRGSYVEFYFPRLGMDLLKILNAAGFGMALLEKERSSGMSKITNRLVDEATRDAHINISSISQAIEAGKRPILTTSSTSAYTIREEFPHLLHVDSAPVRDDIIMATKFIGQLIEQGRAEFIFKPDYKLRVAYHTPCHLERLGWTVYSTELLRMIPGVELTVLDSGCCGIAGTYGMKKENYIVAQKIGAPLFKKIKSLNPDVVATDCETCKWQIEMSSGYTVMNPISIFADALDVEATAKANGVTAPQPVLKI